MSVHRVCRFLGALLFIVHVHGVPNPHPFLPPHLFFINDRGETQISMEQDIASFLKAVPCEIDLVVDFLYQDAARSFFPNTVASRDHRIYNGNIHLLSLINRYQLTDEMCAVGLLKDLTSTKFCSDLAMEEYFEKDFVVLLSNVLTESGFKNLMDVANVLRSIKDEKECEMRCGGRYMSSLCRMFTDLSHFFIEEMKKKCK